MLFQIVSRSQAAFVLHIAYKRMASQVQISTAVNPRTEINRKLRYGRQFSMVANWDICKTAALLTLSS